MTKAVLCADIGSSSIKAAFIGIDGEVIANSSCKIEKAGDSNCWLFVFKQTVSALLEQIESTNQKECEQNASEDNQKGNNYSEIQIIAISISGAGPSFANSAGSFLWNDQTSPNFAKTIPQIADGSIFLPRLFYIQQNLPSLLQKDEPLFSVPEYLIFQLTGKAYTLLPNERYKKAYWDKERLLAMNIEPSALPEFIELGKPFGSITREQCDFLGISKIVDTENLPKVFCGGPDFAIALIGTNTLIPGRICDRAGSSEGINLCTAAPIFDKTVRTLPSPIEPNWNASVIIPESGSRFSAWKKQSIYKDMRHSECVAAVFEDKNSDGYKILIDIANEVKNAVYTLKNLAQKYDIPFDSKICSTGGQAKNKAWLDVKSEIVGIPFYTLKCQDSELIGNATVALYGLGYYSSILEASIQVQVVDSF